MKRTQLEVAIVFALLALPLTWHFSVYYPDEWHYTDGAIQMLKSGDWLLPQTAEGAPRFVKPPLTYWLTAASFKVFGVGVFQSRFPFLVLCTVTILIAGRLGYELTKWPEAGILAAAVVASHPQFILTASRSMPDAPLILGLTLSMLGLCRVVFYKPSPAAYWYMYGGMVIAFLSKGLWGILPLVWGAVFLTWRDRQLRALRRLIYWPGMVALGAVIVAWFSFLYQLRGAHEFFSDQGLGRLTHSIWMTGGFVLAGLLGVLFNFLPWSLPAVENLLTKRRIVFQVLDESKFVFLVGWVGLNVLVVSLGDSVSLRYYLISLPAMAVLLSAGTIAGLSDLKVFRPGLLRLLVWIVPTLGIWVVIGFFGLLGFVSDSRHAKLLDLLAMGLLANVALWWIVSRLRTFEPLTWGVAVMIMFAALGVVPLVAGVRDKAEQIASTLRHINISRSEPVYFVGKAPIASRIRVCLGGTMDVRWFREYDDEKCRRARILVGRSDAFGPGVTNRFVVLMGGVGAEVLSPRDWPISEIRSPSELLHTIVKLERYWVLVDPRIIFGREEAAAIDYR